MPTGRHEPRDVIGVGFLLAQLGAHCASAYAARVAPVGLTPPHVGLLRSIAASPDRSQQALADEFGMLASRMVVFVDDLEERGLVKRRRDENDRRVHLLHLTPAGGRLMQQLVGIATEAEEQLLRSLSPAEHEQLTTLLARVAEDQGLRSGVHPGYGRLRPESR